MKIANISSQKTEDKLSLKITLSYLRLLGIFEFVSDGGIRRLTPLGDPYTDVGHMCVIIMVLYSLYKVSVTFLVCPENYYYIVGTYGSFGKRDSRS